MNKTKGTKTENLAVPQGDYKVGNKKPPKEYQWESGQSGNPKGAPKHRVNLWVWFCKYSNMTDKQLEKLDKSKLTQAQQSALKLIQDMKEGKYSGSCKLARYVIDRDEGKAIEHLIIDEENTLTDEECERIYGDEQCKSDSWPHPVISDGRLYLRDQEVLLCYELKASD
jgi:hypothetical protein